jgi:hypothetical protein
MSDAHYAWTAIASAAAAWVALMLSGGSLFVSRKAMKIAERQESEARRSNRSMGPSDHGWIRDYREGADSFIPCG